MEKKKNQKNEDAGKKRKCKSTERRRKSGEIRRKNKNGRVKTADGGGLSHRSKWLTFSLALITLEA